MMMVERVSADGFGATDAQGEIDSAEDTRRSQGYGPGSGIGG